MAARDVRIFDAQVLNGLRQGTAFFASATMLATGGVLALIGNADKLIDVADDLSLQPVAEVVWEIKLFLTLLLVTNAFFEICLGPSPVWLLCHFDGGRAECA